ncbi:MAG: 3-dehydroquinate synthase [Sphingobium sp.]|nr:3-dehydroquinate synthase [Sphingobium sp.]
MTTVPVSLGERSYEVRVEPGLLERAGEVLEPYAGKRPFVIVTDENVAAQPFFWTLYNALSSVGPAPQVIKLPPGESTKSWSQLETLTDRLIELGVERSDHVIALGGGVIGDLVGFAASVVKRGCNFIQIPTTLLAQVDSSVGGKTAINSRAGKNLIGAFHQPALVLIDPDTLDTLPPRETRAGYAEIVKYGLIDDPDFFGWCEANGTALLNGSGAAREYAIAKSVAAKAAIVSEDERETTGRRALLNLGHTFGHALEADTGFSDRLLHGEAVAAGMALAFAYSVRRGECSGQEAGRIAGHLRTAGLPASLADAGVSASGETLVGYMLHDKKMAGGTLPFLLARGIGQTYLAKNVDLADVAAFLDESRDR